MEASRRSKKPNKFQQTALCCSCKLSVSSSSSSSSSSCSSSSEKSTGYDRYPAAISSLAHAIVQERLDQMIKQRQKEARHRDRRRSRSDGTKFIIMVAMEKSSYDPREDFKESMIEIIITNRLQEPGELRNLLNYYISMNSQDYHGLILEIFHEVCINLFLR